MAFAFAEVYQNYLVAADPVEVGKVRLYYTVTAFDPLTLEETIPDTITHVDIDWNALTESEPNIFTVKVTWTADPLRPVTYNVYRLLDGVPGLVGTANTGEFTDRAYFPNITIGPAQPINTDDLGYPAAVAYFRERRVFGGFVNAPAALQLSKTGLPYSFTKSIPSLPTDAIHRTLVTDTAQSILHLVSYAGLIALTTDRQWRLETETGVILSPSSLRADPITQWSVRDIKPVVLGSRLLYVSANGRYVRDLDANTKSGIITGRNVNLFAQHMTDDNSIIRWAEGATSDFILLAMLQDGTAIIFTSIADEQLEAWTRLKTDGVLQELVALPHHLAEAGTATYACVKRTIFYDQSETTEYLALERLTERVELPLGESFFVDGGVFQGSEVDVQVIHHLWHLEGRAVTAVVDGVAYSGLTVEKGAVALPVAGRQVSVGLPYVTKLATLPFEAGQGTIQGRLAIVSEVVLRLEKSLGGRVAHGGNTFTDIAHDDLIESAEGGLYTTEIRVPVDSSWDLSKVIRLEQHDPYPFTLLSVAPVIYLGSDEVTDP